MARHGTRVGRVGATAGEQPPFIGLYDFVVTLPDYPLVKGSTHLE